MKDAVVVCYCSVAKSCPTLCDPVERWSSPKGRGHSGIGKKTRGKKKEKKATSNSLQPHGLWPTRLLCPWNSPFITQECWSAYSSSGDLPNPGIEPGSAALQIDPLPSEPNCSFTQPWSRESQGVTTDSSWQLGWRGLSAVGRGFLSMSRCLASFSQIHSSPNGPYSFPADFLPGERVLTPTFLPLQQFCFSLKTNKLAQLMNWSLGSQASRNAPWTLLHSEFKNKYQVSKLTELPSLSSPWAPQNTPLSHCF